MRELLSFPVKIVQGRKWLDLTAHGVAHEFCGERHIVKDEQYSFSGGHRVRLVHLKKNVHWLMPTGGVTLNIEDVEPVAKAPPRRQTRAR